jgi:uncharacterized protein (TIGR02246 family)
MTGAARILVLLTLVDGVAACGAPGAQRRAQADSSADAKAIEAAVRSYVTASNQGDIEALASLYTEDAVLLPPDHIPIEGRKAITEFWRQGTDHDLAIHTIRVDVQHDLGYLVGRYTLPATDEEPADSGKYLLCLKRQRDGSWKVTADIWNSSVTPDSDRPDDPEHVDSNETSPRWQLTMLVTERASIPA